MVFMPVGKHNAKDVFFLREYGLQAGDDHVNAEE